MNEIENLVSLLYSPGTPPDVLQKSQRSLQIAQKSANGWELAKTLLSSANPQSQFLGAQTFIVKLNEGSNLPSSEQQHEDLLMLLNYAVQQNLAPFVTRKLLGAITKVYLGSEDWKDCPYTVVQILGARNFLAFEFLNFLVEDSELPAASLRAKLVPNISKLVLDMLKESQLMTTESIKTFEVWSSTFFDQFKDITTALTELALGLFEKVRQESGQGGFDEERVVAMLNVLSDLYTNNWKSWPLQARRRLTESLTHNAHSFSEFPPAEFNDNDLFIAFARLIIGVCQEDFETNTELHPFLVKLAAAPVPVVEDPLAVETLEFWNQFTEEVISSGLNSAASASAEAAISMVISGYWPRIKLYPELRNSDWEEFSSFRKDFADFIELAYPIMGPQLFSQLTEVVVSSLHTSVPSTSPAIGIAASPDGQQSHVNHGGSPDWLSIESGLYCLNGLSDIIGEDYRGDKPEFRSVQQIFQSDLWRLLPQCDNFRVRQTAVNLIGCFVDFFLSPEGSAYLAVTLNFLFTCLDSEPLQNTASRSIQKLCDTCQSELVDEISAFVAIYSRIRNELKSVPHIRTVGGIACVVQAIDNLKLKGEVINELLDLIVTATNPHVEPLEVQQTRLKCVAILGKNIQTVDLLQPGGSALKVKKRSAGIFWSEDEVSLQIKSKLHEILASAVGSTDLTSIEAVCDIVKAGITEGTGPFFLEENFVVSFVVAKSSSPVAAEHYYTITPILDLARFYIMSRVASLRQRKIPGIPPEEINSLLSVVIQQGSQSASAALDLLTQFVNAASVMDVPLLQLDPQIAVAFDLPLAGIQSGDRFVLRSAATFWKEYLGNPNQTVPKLSNDSNISLDPRVAQSLAEALLNQLSGIAARSDLGPLSDVVKVLFSKHSLLASQLFKHYIVDSPLNERIARQDTKARSDFVAQLVLVKGARKTSDIVQRFWLKCKGIPESYDPHLHAGDSNNTVINLT